MLGYRSYQVQLTYFPTENSNSYYDNLMDYLHARHLVAQGA